MWYRWTIEVNMAPTERRRRVRQGEVEEKKKRSRLWRLFSSCFSILFPEALAWIEVMALLWQEEKEKRERGGIRRRVWGHPVLHSNHSHRWKNQTSDWLAEWVSEQLWWEKAKKPFNDLPARQTRGSSHYDEQMEMRANLYLYFLHTSQAEKRSNEGPWVIYGRVFHSFPRELWCGFGSQDNLIAMRNNLPTSVPSSSLLLLLLLSSPSSSSSSPADP